MSVGELYMIVMTKMHRKVPGRHQTKRPVKKQGRYVPNLIQLCYCEGTRTIFLVNLKTFGGTSRVYVQFKPLNFYLNCI